MTAIEMRDIVRSYWMEGEELQVLKSVSLTIEEGEFVAITGPSGSGKSTLMQIMGLLDRPTSGTYRLLGRDVSRLTDDEGASFRSKTIGFVFQMFNLLPRTSALDNVVMPMIYSGAPRREERAREILDEVGLSDRIHHRPNELSGGQQQRVAIARALVNRPRILFADEPTGNLASDQAEEIIGRLILLNRSGITVILVTHEPDIAARARRIIHIKDGKIVSDEKTARQGSGSGSPSRSSAHPATSHLTKAEFLEHAVSALKAMAANKVRSGLSILGVLVGVAALIAMLAVGKGAQKAIEARLASLGSNLLMIFSGSPSTRGIRGAAGNYSRLTLEDSLAVRKAGPGVADVYPEAEGNVQVVYGDKNTKTELQGVTPNYESIRNAKPYAGRFFTDREDMELARVVLLGQTVVSVLFGSEDPVFKTVKINHIAFQVVGVLPSKGGSGFGDQDDMIVIPIRTAMRRVLGTEYLHEMGVQCASTEALSSVMEDATRVLRHRHRLPAYKEDDFTLRNMADVQSALAGTTKTFSALLGAVAAVSLLVGGVGMSRPTNPAPPQSHLSGPTPPGVGSLTF